MADATSRETFHPFGSAAITAATSNASHGGHLRCRAFLDFPNRLSYPLVLSWTAFFPIVQTAFPSSVSFAFHWEHSFFRIEAAVLLLSLCSPSSPYAPSTIHSTFSFSVVALSARGSASGSAGEASQLISICTEAVVRVCLCVHARLC